MSTIFTKNNSPDNHSSRKSLAPNNKQVNNNSEQWASVDSVLENFNKYGDLPPLLSPTLPAWTSGIDKAHKKSSSVGVKKHSRSGSKGISKKINDDEVEDSELKNDNAVNDFLDLRNDLRMIEMSANNKEFDLGIPDLMLSPTLPQIFNLENSFKEHRKTLIDTIPDGFHREGKQGGHFWLIKNQNGKKSFKLVLLLRPRLLRELLPPKNTTTTTKATSKPSDTSNNTINNSPSPASSTTSTQSKRKMVLEEKRRKAQSYYSDSEDEKEPAKSVKKVRTPLPSSPRMVKSPPTSRTTPNASLVRSPPLSVMGQKRLVKPISADAATLTQLKSILSAKKKLFGELAKQQKHAADNLVKESINNRSMNKLKIIVMGLESLLLFMTSFIYDDHLRGCDRVAPNNQQWSSLIPYLTMLLKKLESNTNNSEEKNALVGLACQMRSSINHHIKSITLRRIKQFVNRKEEIENLKKKNSLTDGDRLELKEIESKLLSNYYPKSIKVYEDFEIDFIKGENHLNFLKLNKSYPMTVAANSKARIKYQNSSFINSISSIEYFDEQNNSIINEIKGFQVNNTIPSNSLHRLNDLMSKFENEDVSKKMFNLPFNPYLEPQQVVAYGYSILKEWCDKNNMKYDWKV